MKRRDNQQRASWHRLGGVFGGKIPYLLLGASALIVMGFIVFQLFSGTATNPVKKLSARLNFDNTLTGSERTLIEKAIESKGVSKRGITVHVTTSTKVDPKESTLAAYVPVMNAYTTTLEVSHDALAKFNVEVPANTNPLIKKSISKALGLKTVGQFTGSANNLKDNVVAFIPAKDLSYKVRLLTLDGSYYLDNFNSGAVFRQASFAGLSAESLSRLKLSNLPTKKDTLKVNMTGVTALTRKYTTRIKSGTKPPFFSARIASFLKNADIVHTSNEISFDSHCHNVNTGLIFCAMPSTIETLKDAGINLIELTGNHNNNFGAADNAATIREYHKLGWHTFGGGINDTEAAKPYVANMKGSKVAFLGYNYADTVLGDSGALASATQAGANSFSFEKIKADIAKAKASGDFVIVDVQFLECYSYPTEHTEIPLCDQPIAKQEETFRKIIDEGADMVIGTQAHQPQTYEVYKGKQIYYGLGNLFFEQTEWPGTERGIILTHYFAPGGKLLQTRLTPTTYDDNLQVHKMTDSRSISYFLNRLKTARTTAGMSSRID